MGGGAAPIVPFIYSGELLLNYATIGSPAILRGTLNHWQSRISINFCLAFIASSAFPSKSNTGESIPYSAALETGNSSLCQVGPTSAEFRLFFFNRPALAYCTWYASWDLQFHRLSVAILKYRLWRYFEKKYAEFKRCVEMPERGTPLHNWQQNQLSNTHGSSLNAKILNECAENKGSETC
jgi:hypothetical protein